MTEFRWLGVCICESYFWYSVEAYAMKNEFVTAKFSQFELYHMTGFKGIKIAVIKNNVTAYFLNYMESYRNFFKTAVTSV